MFSFLARHNNIRESGAWSIGSVRASGAVGPEFEPTFCHSLLSGGPWQDLVSSVRLEPLTFIRCVCGTKNGLNNQEEAWNQPVRRRKKGRAEHSSGHQEFIPNAGIYKNFVSTREMNTT